MERLGERRVRVTIEAGRSSPAVADAKDQRFTAASTMIDSDDPMVKQLAMDVLGRIKGDARQRAEALREAVSGHIRSANLGVGLATASEVVRTRTGDCTEYAVLLAAVLRAAGIPSRVVSGVVFVDELAGAQRVFGYHMWAQAVVPGAGGEPVWIDLDSAIATPELGGIDATHIALAVTSLSEDDAMGSMAAMVGVLGRLAIEAERVEH
jgi:transglutaminase-like putative cysteine protease